MAYESSQAAIDEIVSDEVTGRNAYTRLYQRPTWPEGASGVTIGIGYDLGYASREEIQDDWGKYVSPAMLQAMLSVCGVHGEPARIAAQQVRNDISIPFDVAMQVFENHDIPKWTARLRAALPNTDKLSPDSFGALLSLVYNRGCSFTLQGDRYREMRNIKTWMEHQEFQRIPGEIRSMKRLWNNGLVARREREAALFERGLNAKSVPATVPTPAPAPAPKPAPAPAPAPKAAAPKSLLQQIIELLLKLFTGGR